MVRNDRSRWFSTMVQHNGSRCSRRRVRGQALCHCVAFATQRGLSRAVELGMTARRYQELEVWQLCEEIRQRVLAETTRKLPSWDRSFCDQIRDAAEDATADVAEGFVRFKPREFAQFLGYALIPWQKSVNGHAMAMTEAISARSLRPNSFASVCGPTRPPDHYGNISGGFRPTTSHTIPTPGRCGGSDAVDSVGTADDSREPP